MSNIFTYEIDERNLRIQLKSMEVPLREDAWHKFEAYAGANPFEAPRGRFKSFEINLNRSVVLPVVFGVIICLFSFLLFNFITIKNPSGERVQKTTAPENKEVAAEQKTGEIIPAALHESIAKEEVLTAPATEVVEVPAEIPVNEQVKEPSVEANAVNTAILDAPAVKTVSHKRRNKEEEEALSAIKPTIVSDEDESEPVPTPN